MTSIDPAAQPNIIQATLSPGGLRYSSPCVYIASAKYDSQRVFYVGRTGTSNATGVSAPFKRLASHLSKRGNTHSMFWRNSQELRREWFSQATIEFHAMPLPYDHAATAENWLMSQIDESLLLNIHPCRITPVLCSQLESNLKTLLERSIR